MLFQIIYVSRNPKDNAVSYFYHHKIAQFLGPYTGSFNDFMTLYTRGQRTCVSVMNILKSKTIVLYYIFILCDTAMYCKRLINVTLLQVHEYIKTRYMWPLIQHQESYHIIVIIDVNYVLVTSLAVHTKIYILSCSNFKCIRLVRPWLNVCSVYFPPRCNFSTMASLYFESYDNLSERTEDAYILYLIYAISIAHEHVRFRV